MEKLDVLCGSALFEMCSNHELAHVAELARERHFTAGQTVIEEGELGDSVFVIASGELEVIRRDASGALQIIAVLAQRDFFGEMSLIDKEYRSASVRARGEVELLELTTDDLTVFRKQHRDGFTFVVINIARMLSARVREANARLAARL